MLAVGPAAVPEPQPYRGFQKHPERVPPAHSSVQPCYRWVGMLGLGCQCSAAQVQTQVRAGHYPRCSVPSSHQHAAVPSQHPCCNIAWEKSNPTVSLLPLGILPLGGQRGCLPSLPGHSTLREPKTRKVLISPATDRRREVSVPHKKLHPAPSRCQHPRP